MLSQRWEKAEIKRGFGCFVIAYQNSAGLQRGATVPALLTKRWLFLAALFQPSQMWAELPACSWHLSSWLLAMLSCWSWIGIVRWGRGPGLLVGLDLNAWDAFTPWRSCKDGYTCRPGCTSAWLSSVKGKDRSLETQIKQNSVPTPLNLSGTDLWFIAWGREGDARPCCSACWVSVLLQGAVPQPCPYSQTISHKHKELRLLSSCPWGCVTAALRMLLAQQAGCSTKHVTDTWLRPACKIWKMEPLEDTGI